MSTNSKTLKFRAAKLKGFTVAKDNLNIENLMQILENFLLHFENFLLQNY